MGHPRHLSRCYDCLCRLQVERLCLTATVNPSYTYRPETAYRRGGRRLVEIKRIKAAQTHRK